MFDEMPRRILIVVLLACVLGLLLWARGPEHHHGRYVGALGVAPSAAQPVHS